MLHRYEKLVRDGVLKADSRQLACLKGPLQRLTSANDNLGGVYLHGPVGCGKTMLMDLFVDHNKFLGKRVFRTHFNTFMMETHMRIHGLRPKVKQLKNHIVVEVAQQYAEKVDVLAFDELQVTDIADAMILGRLLSTIMGSGVQFITTSNRPPSELYKGGLNRDLFLPTIEMLKEKCDEFDMSGMNDYRLEKARDISYHDVFLEASNTSVVNTIWKEAGGDLSSEENISLLMGRTINVERSTKRAAWFNFSEICEQPTGAADFYEVARRYDLIIITQLPRMSTQLHNEARRFITLLDAMYEYKVTVVLTAGAESPQALFNDLLESDIGLQSGNPPRVSKPATAMERDLMNRLGIKIKVKDEGGASAKQTTYVDETEWSATGQIGVSLFALSSVEEVKFAYSRAVSRLIEMQSREYLSLSKGGDLVRRETLDLTV